MRFQLGSGIKTIFPACPQAVCSWINIILLALAFIFPLWNFLDYFKPVSVISSCDMGFWNSVDSVSLFLGWLKYIIFSPKTMLLITFTAAASFFYLYQKFHYIKFKDLPLLFTLPFIIFSFAASWKISTELSNFAELYRRETIDKTKIQEVIESNRVNLEASLINNEIDATLESMDEIVNKLTFTDFSLYDLFQHPKELFNSGYRHIFYNTDDCKKDLKFRFSVEINNMQVMKDISVNDVIMPLSFSNIIKKEKKIDYAFQIMGSFSLFYIFTYIMISLLGYLIFFSGFLFIRIKKR